MKRRFTSKLCSILPALNPWLKWRVFLTRATQSTPPTALSQRGSTPWSLATKTDWSGRPGTSTCRHQLLSSKLRSLRTWRCSFAKLSSSWCRLISKEWECPGAGTCGRNCTSSSAGQALPQLILSTEEKASSSVQVSMTRTACATLTTSATTISLPSNRRQSPKN